jgi:RimJ/RimL family protein N-acetyltransferase
LKRKAQDWWSNQQDIFADVDRPLSVVLSESNELVGVCGFLIADQPNEPDEWEAWLLLRSKYWGKAMGVEITSALIAVAFKSLAAQRVIGIVDPANHASLAMIKKLGFSYMRDYSDPSNPSNWQNGHHIYGVESNTISPTLRRDKAG